MKSIAVIGTGAIGGYYGALLAKAGNEVHFLLRSDYQHVLEHGLLVTSGEEILFSGKVNAWNSASAMPKCDLILITLKTTENDSLKSILPEVCHESSIVLVLQNGLDTDKDVAEAVPDIRIFGGLCSIACNKIGPGRINHINYNKIQLGEHGNIGISEQLQDISKLLNKAGIATALYDNLFEARWRKIVWNITFNGLTTVLDCDTKVIMNSPEHRDRAVKIMKEAIDVANASGCNIESEFVKTMITLTDAMNPYKPSMKLDYERGSKLELEVIYKRPIEYARKNNCEIPEIKRLYGELLELEEKRSGRTDGHTHRKKNTSAETGKTSV